MRRKIKIEDIYDRLPGVEQQTGDIWSGVPRPPLLHGQAGSAIVISPACDLSNYKLETVTMLPILTTTEWFTTLSFAPELTTICNDLLAAGVLRLQRYPSAEEIEVIHERIEEITKEWPTAKKAQFQAAIVCLRRIYAHENSGTGELACAFGKAWKPHREKIVRNTLRSDVHFLPADQQDPEWSGVPSHSVILLRYPFTVPASTLNAAAYSETAESSLRSTANAKPLKRVRLRERFFADLLSRYLALYGRVGAPSFSKDTVNTLLEEICP